MRVVFGVHPGVGYEHRTAQVPAPQIVANRLHRADIGCVAGQHPASNRDAFPGHGQGYDHLRGPGPLLGVSELSKRCVVITLGIVFEVDTEGGGGGVVEDQIHLQVEQVCGVKENRLLNFGCVLIEQIHGFVHVPQLQLITGWQVDRLHPSVPDPEFGVRITQPVGSHRKQSPFVDSRGPGGFSDIDQGLLKTNLLPEPFDGQHRSQGDGPIDLQASGKRSSRGCKLVLLLAVRIDNSQVADPGDGPTQPHQLLTVELIGAAEVVDDLGDRLSGNRVAFIVGQLVVFDDGAVLVLSSGSAQVHAQACSV